MAMSTEGSWIACLERFLDVSSRTTMVTWEQTLCRTMSRRIAVWSCVIDEVGAGRVAEYDHPFVKSSFPNVNLGEFVFVLPPDLLWKEGKR